ncbi:DegT/DnrJ/EryC1/StrS aminotransferase family protein [Bradyrhizobium sp. sBnM-33]|uniref:DegT/DnrJ/EryC1/StrS family aminotransferase n=1 Tax=Bradyrhizobium sp. sBnM-33 TaxID=2831780 RepID=UPI001BD0CE97|nr:DegT/DnrJ/EryC1/StrS aminotransferase family protein [Bradyrhizobium sp. sBnM-33]WOH48824.1 DegT/DnrJ/EryC1/StrS aminotransferase family protein [Bradyrhizobium sp. sBnM-33]
MRVTKEIPFIDIAEQRTRLKDSIDQSIKRVLDHGQFINGPEVAQLEVELGFFSDSKHVVSCASGTDALLMVLMAKGVGAGDAVICPSFTFCATAEVVVLVGATPIFVDVNEETFNIDPVSLKQGIALAKQLGLQAKAVIPVDLFGQAADHHGIEEVAAAEGLFVLDDAAQSFGASCDGRRLGTFGLATTTSFFPAKPLGCYGDGGAIFTNDAELASLLRSIRVHGQGAGKYDNVRIGLTARLDTIQAAILLEKLKIFDDEVEARQSVARRYTDALRDVVSVPHVVSGNRSVWAQYTIRLPQELDRKNFMEGLKTFNIPTMIYYERPMHQQTAYRGYPKLESGLPVSEALSKRVVSLPMHPYLDRATQDYIIEVIRRYVLQQGDNAPA